MPAVLEAPRPPLAPLAVAATAAVGLPLALYRSRVARYTLGGGALAVGGGGAWLVHALRDRLQFFTETQQRLQREQRERGAEPAA